MKVLLRDGVLPLECLEGSREVFLLKLSDDHERDFSAEVELIDSDGPGSVGGKGLAILDLGVLILLCLLLEECDQLHAFGDSLILALTMDAWKLFEFGFLTILHFNL